MPVRATKKARDLGPFGQPPASAVTAGRARLRRRQGSIRIFAANWCRMQRAPGRAVSEAEIALAYGVSRTPVREAILKLSDEGLLDIFPQSGIFVSRIPIAALPEAIIIRRALEATTARLAAERAASSQILVLHSMLERQREANAAREQDAFHRADEMFHATIAEIAGYPGIWTLIQQVKVHVDRYRLLTLPHQGHIARVIAEHEAILAAIENHDPAGARAAMEFHLDLERLAQPYLRHTKYPSGILRRDGACVMTALNILSGGAAQGLVASLAPKFKALTGLDIEGEFGAVGAMADKLRGGTPTDIAVLTAAKIAESGPRESCCGQLRYPTSASVETAMAVRAGDPKVSVGDAAALREAFLAADAIFVPDTKASTAGIHVAKILQQLGIADTVAGAAQDFSRMARPRCAIWRRPMRRGRSAARNRPKSSARPAWSCPDRCRKSANSRPCIRRR